MCLHATVLVTLLPYTMDKATPPDYSSSANSESGNAPNSSDIPQTPPRPTSAHTMPGSSPFKHHSVHSHDFLNGDLYERRDELMEDFDYAVPEIGVKDFIEHLLPPLPGVRVDDIVESLQQKGLVVQSGQDRTRRQNQQKWTWKQYLEFPKGREDHVFAPLAEIFSDITDCASEKLGRNRRTLLFCMSPHSTPRSERDSSTRPDAYFMLRDVEEATLKEEAIEQQKIDEMMKRESGERIRARKFKLPRFWYDIALTLELKKAKSDEMRDDVRISSLPIDILLLISRSQNVSKLTFNIHHTMAVDPCRRFTFGITIEKTSMRLWFCSRATPFVSEPFDFALVSSYQDLRGEL